MEPRVIKLMAGTKRAAEQFKGDMVREACEAKKAHLRNHLRHQWPRLLFDHRTRYAALHNEWYARGSEG